MASTTPLDGVGPTVVVDIDPAPETKADAATDRGTSSASPSRHRSKSRVPAVPGTPAPQPPPAAVAERRAAEEAERIEAERKEAEPKLREFDQRLDGTPPPPPASRVSGVAAGRAPQHGKGCLCPACIARTHGAGCTCPHCRPTTDAAASAAAAAAASASASASASTSASYATTSAAAAASASASASESGSVGATIAAGGQHALRDSDAFDELLANGFVVETKEEGSGKRRPRKGDVVQVKVETYVSDAFGGGACACVRACVCVRVCACMCVDCSYALPSSPYSLRAATSLPSAPPP